ncbi:leucine-rich repeat protein [Tanacetum coccineum]
MSYNFATVSTSLWRDGDLIFALLSFKSKITISIQSSKPRGKYSFHFCDWSGVSWLESDTYECGLWLDFQGTIPHELGRLSRLRRLYLDVNRFSGVIPTNLSRCSNLEDLLANNYTGGIPPFLGNITLMKFFSASGNPFGGSIPNTLGLWKSLTTFYCYDCNLYGSIPRSIFNLSLQLRDNELKGVLPPSISNCSKLIHLEMSNNNFSGKLTIDFSKLRYINIIVLNFNNFHGRVMLVGFYNPDVKLAEPEKLVKKLAQLINL